MEKGSFSADPSAHVADATETEAGAPSAAGEVYSIAEDMLKARARHRQQRANDILRFAGLLPRDGGQ